MGKKLVTNDLYRMLEGHQSIRHLRYQGDQIVFSLYGVPCMLILKNGHYFFGVELYKYPVESLTRRQLSEITLVLAGEKGVPNLAVFISEQEKLCLFNQYKDDLNAEKICSEFENLLIVRSCMNKLLTGSGSKTLDPVIDKNWVEV